MPACISKPHGKRNESQHTQPGYMCVFLKTAGADSPQPMKLRQKASTGEWFLWEYSSILSGIRIPAAEDLSLIHI